MDAKQNVLIVGAGPSGLAMALELTRFNIPVRIIDKKPQATLTSNAGGVHARTLELLDAEVSQALIARGRQSKQVHIKSRDKDIACVNLELINSKYPYVLLIPQSDTEAVLIAALQSKGVTVEWNKTLQSLTQENNRVTAQVQTDTGTETITADWLFASDGYHSTVRDFLKIPYEGKDLLLRFIMIDTQLEMEKPFEYFTAFPGVITLVIVPFMNSVRLIAQIANADDELPQDQTPDEVIFTKICERYFTQKFTIHKPTWASRFYIHQKLAARYREQRIFLGGDAAHTHSPVGGHGMNTGIQDAINLAWKLAMVIHDQAHEKLLDSYEQERRAIAQQIIATTHHQTGLMMLHNKYLIALRNTVLPFVSKIPLLSKKIAEASSETAIHYRHSNIICKNEHSAELKAGDRFPNIKLNGNDHELSRTTHTLLDFSHQEHNNTLPETCLQSLNIIKINNPDSDTLKLFGFDNNVGYCLVRPDQYIAYIGKELQPVSQYFNNLLQ